MTTPRLPIDAVMFDLDGTLVLSDRKLGGYQALPGAAETLDWLQREGIPFVAMTNGSAHPPRVQGPKLRAAGLPIPDERLMTPSTVAARVLPRDGVRRCMLLGVPGSGVPLAEAGVELVEAAGDAPEVDAVYVAWHPDCRLSEIEAAARAIWAGARLYVASDVPFFATRSGRAPGYSSVIAAAIRHMAETEMHLTGKPSAHAFGAVAEALGVAPGRIAVVGDDPVCEIGMARDRGAVALATLTGVTDAGAWAAMPEGRGPHRVLDSIADLRGLIEGMPA